MPRYVFRAIIDCAALRDLRIVDESGHDRRQPLIGIIDILACGDGGDCDATACTVIPGTLYLIVMRPPIVTCQKSASLTKTYDNLNRVVLKDVPDTSTYVFDVAYSYDMMDNGITVPVH